MEALCFLLPMMMSTTFGLVIPYDSPPDSTKLPINQLQFDSEYERMEFALAIAKELDDMRVDPTEKYVLVSATEFAEVVNTLYEVHHTNEDLMKVVELMEIASKTKTARWYYYIDITICAFLAGILFGFLLIAALIVYELRIRSCNGIIFFAVLLALTAFFNYYVITYFHQIHFSILSLS